MRKFLFLPILVIFLTLPYFSKLFSAEKENQAYQEDELGKWGKPLSFQLGTDPPIYGSDHYGEPVKSELIKVIKVGIVLLKKSAMGKEKLYYLLYSKGIWRLNGGL